MYTSRGTQEGIHMSETIISKGKEFNLGGFTLLSIDVQKILTYVEGLKSLRIHQMKDLSYV